MGAGAGNSMLGAGVGDSDSAAGVGDSGSAAGVGDSGSAMDPVVHQLLRRRQQRTGKKIESVTPCRRNRANTSPHRQVSLYSYSRDLGVS